MKKIILILVIVTLVCLLTACGNFQYYDEDYYKVNYALVNIKGEWIEVEVKSWSRTDSNGMVGIVLNDGTVLMTSAENCILYDGTLPTTSNGIWKQRVIEDACKELEVSADGATLELVYTEYVPWLECNVYNYILTLADGSKWLVGAKENEDGFDADVECQL